MTVHARWRRGTSYCYAGDAQEAALKLVYAGGVGLIERAGYYDSDWNIIVGDPDVVVIQDRWDDTARSLNQNVVNRVAQGRRRGS
jgi:hypothetical protein